MTFRTIGLIAASVIIGTASIVITSAQTFARTPAGTTRLHHHHHHKGVHHSGQVQAKPPASSATKQ